MQATYNKEGRRTGLSRQWDSNKPGLVVIQSQPSTASHTQDDHTTSRLINIAKHLNRGRLELYNLHPSMSTIQLNDLKAAIELQPEVVVAWGGEPRKNAPRECLQLFRSFNYQGRVCCFGLCKNGAPIMGTRSTRTSDIVLQQFQT